MPGSDLQDVDFETVRETLTLLLPPTTANCVALLAYAGSGLLDGANTLEGLEELEHKMLLTVAVLVANRRRRLSA